jgi:hypothetical protein
LNKNIKVIQFPGIENAYVVISGKPSDIGNGCKKQLTFFYGDADGGCEWEPDYGALTKIIPMKKDDVGAIPHWFYDYYAGPGHWSQCAVEERNLPKLFLSGNYEGMFAMMKEFAK